MRALCTSYPPLHEPVATVITARSAPDGALLLIVHAPWGDRRFKVEERSFAISVWGEAEGVVRMSLRVPNTGTVGHLQGGAALLTFFRDLGLQLC
jgi:hypothetical protein